MTDSGAEAVVKVHATVAGIGREAWDACAGPLGDPFVSFDFLDALEESGSVAPRAGWIPRHLSVEDAAGRIAGVMPLYLKSHSRGEYVFDWAWAEAYERAGGRYYPKLLSAVPFTPVTGSRLIVRPGADQEAARRVLLSGAMTLCERHDASSLHITFPTGEEQRWLANQGLLPRQDQQYHWHNQGYPDFDAFLAALSANHRKSIRRERRDAQAAVEIVALTGAQLTEAHWDAFFEFYTDTGARKWGDPYLNRDFFSLLSERMADSILLLLARREGRWVAGALNLIGADALYGRYWGATAHVPFLHFELCYYQAIEHAIARRLSRVEAGAQGQHKIARGYLPAPVYSAHFIADPALRTPVARYLDQERGAVRHEMEALTEAFSPFRHNG